MPFTIRLRPLRPVIPQVVHKLLDCGNLDRGFARVRCDHFRHEYLLAFGRCWFCPTCRLATADQTNAFGPSLIGNRSRMVVSHWLTSIGWT